MDGTTAVLDISTLIYNGAAAENRNTTYIAKGGKLSHNTAALKVMSGDTYTPRPRATSTSTTISIRTPVPTRPALRS